MTLGGEALLQRGMEPFSLRVDWTCHAAYPEDPVVVELHVTGREPKVIHRCDSSADAAGWARRWLEGRGFSFWCDICWHQREGHTYVILHTRGG